jgi:hypothetical protein
LLPQKKRGPRKLLSYPRFRSNRTCPEEPRFSWTSHRARQFQAPGFTKLIVKNFTIGQNAIPFYFAFAFFLRAYL